MKYCLCSYSWISFDPPVLNLGRVLGARGHTVVAVGICRPGDAVDETVSRGFSIRRLSCLGSNVYDRGLVAGLRYVVKVCRLANTIRPDYYIAYNWNSFLAAVVARKVCRAPIVYMQTEYNDRRRGASANSRYAARLLLWLEKRYIKDAAAIFSAEPNRSRLMCTDYGLCEPPIAIYNAPLLCTYSGAAKRQRGDKLRVVFLGAISEEAGLRIVLRAFALKPVDAILHLYGLVRPAFKDEFQTLLADVRAAGNDVEYRCTVPYDRVPALLQEYEVGLISYQPHHINQYYCSPAKLFEYIAAGLALVTPDYPGLREIIRPPRLGLCVDPTDPLALADAIGVLASERDETLLMGERARSDFEEKFNFERQAAPLLEALSGGLG